MTQQQFARPSGAAAGAAGLGGGVCSGGAPNWAWAARPRLKRMLVTSIPKVACGGEQQASGGRGNATNVWRGCYPRNLAEQKHEAPGKGRAMDGIFNR